MNSILVIDDEKGLRENLKDILEINDFLVHTASNGIEGLTKALAISPDLILCDITMPMLDGYGFITQIKKTELAGIPIIFLSAKAERGDERLGMSLGADDYITKPFTANEVIDSVKTRLEKSKYLKNKINSVSNHSTFELSKILNGHEIRTPLNIISGMTLMLKGLTSNENEKEANQISKYTQNAIFNLTNIINNIYLFEMLKSELDENLFAVNLPIDITNNIQNLSQEFDRPVSINIDADLFTNKKWMYFINYIYVELVLNAIKFSSEHDNISVTNSTENNSTTISVKNTGGTFNCDPQILKPFNKFSGRMDISGLGLGLYNIKLIAEKINGLLSITNNQDGCEVSVTLPAN